MTSKLLNEENEIDQMISKEEASRRLLAADFEHEFTNRYTLFRCQAEVISNTNNFTHNIPGFKSWMSRKNLVVNDILFNSYNLPLNQVLTLLAKDLTDTLAETKGETMFSPAYTQLSKSMEHLISTHGDQFFRVMLEEINTIFVKRLGHSAWANILLSDTAFKMQDNDARLSFNQKILELVKDRINDQNNTSDNQFRSSWRSSNT